MKVYERVWGENNMPSLILSIHPKYAKMIYEGKKVLEFRKTKPRINIIDTNGKNYYSKSFDDRSNLTWCFLYETSPIQSITGVMLFSNIFDISNYNYNDSLYFLGRKTRILFNGGCPEKIKFPGITEIEFNNYYKNSNKKYAWMITYARNFRCKRLSSKDLDKHINSPPPILALFT